MLDHDLRDRLEDSFFILVGHRRLLLG
jgi:hypothetical protein